MMPPNSGTDKRRSHLHWFIDAMNVIGSRPDGWWRDREGAVRRLVDDVREWARGPTEDDVTVVLDAGPDDARRAPSEP